LNVSAIAAPAISPGEIRRLSLLVEGMAQEKEIEGKINFLKKEEKEGSIFSSLQIPYVSLEEELVIRSVIAIGQEEIFQADHDAVRKLLPLLIEVEVFYAEMGGIIGYHLTLLQLLTQSKLRFPIEKSKYHAPRGLNLVERSAKVHEAIYYAIERMEELAEIYPVGGAADRLNLQDTETGAPLPAALLSFKGRPMLEGLIEDLQAREYLYYKIKGRQITLPVAMMTSQEKNNHERIKQLLEQKKWFSRPKDKFILFCQPLVPAVTQEGKWVLTGPGRLLMKPGGHGVVWKLARDTGVFAWLEAQGVKKALLRQINNPISSEDHGLLAFSGHGLKENKKLGFASCERQVRASEGVNVIVEEKKEEGFSYTLTNIEYCDFHMYRLEDEPAGPDKKHSKFPSNTNVLFVDLASILKALTICPIPGVLVNKKKVTVMTEGSERRELEVARLESTMQNIADCFQKYSSTPLSPDELLEFDSYITFNVRRKTIAATKKEYFIGGSLLETPEGCFLEGMENMRELLQEHCKFSLPSSATLGEHVFTKPSCLFYYHPALGPLYSIIGKKLRKGALAHGSELQLFLAECDIEELSLEGSLLITATQVMGEIDAEGLLCYSDLVGRCTMKNVRVKNQGIDFSKENIFWRREIHRKESLRIFLEGNSEFIAEDLEIEGDRTIVIEDGWRGVLQNQGGQVVLIKEKMTEPLWRWRYFFDKDKIIQLEKETTPLAKE